MAQQKSKLPSNSGLSRELIAYHQSNEDRISSLQTTVDTGVVSSIDGQSGAFTLGYSLSRSGQTLSAALTKITASLGANVSLNNTANYFDGPSVAQGTTGTWFASGTVTLLDTSGSGQIYYLKLWDGTTVVASAVLQNFANIRCCASLSGFFTSPAGNIRISVRDISTASGLILFNESGNSMDSTITAVRIA